MKYSGVKTTFLTFISLFFILTSCKKDRDFTDDEPDDPKDGIFELVIPSDFDFETAQDVQLNINGFKSSRDAVVKYNIYLYSEITTQEEVTYENEEGEMVTEVIDKYDVFNNLVSTVITDQEQFELNLTIPIYYNKLYIIKNDMGLYSSEIVPIENGKAAYFPPQMKAASDDPVDVIYGVNSQADLFTINPVTGEMVIIGSLPSGSGGSVTCALDPVSRVLYTIGGSSKYLYAYDIDEGSWEVRGNTGLSGPRLEYRKEDGLLYFSTSNKVITLNPANAQSISTYTVNGLHNSGWGDVAFDPNGTLFMATKSGLYRCDPIGNNEYDAVRISADNLPYFPTSMTFDSNEELWIGSIENGQGQVVVMDQVTGGWEYRFREYPIGINDLTFLPLDETQVQQVDTDGDGIVDFYDEYPDDGDRAYDTYTPSVYGWGTFAFEDLWPHEGDYDFNDLVVNYRFTHVFNSSDLIVETKWNFVIKNIGGSYRNGFGIELDMDENLIQNVSGYYLSGSIVNLNGKGLEAAQDKPVIIVFDDAWKAQQNSENIEVVISYTSPISEASFGEKNPFIFIDGERGKEVHMSDKEPTSLANLTYFGSEDDDSNPAAGRYYKNSTNLPWAIDIIHNFVYPKEKSSIHLGYNRFGDWAESGGAEFPDWYKDQDGYRNNAYLVVDQ